MSAPSARLSAVVIDCADPAALATFWSAVLDRPVASVEPGWADLEPMPGGITLSFQRVDPHRRARWPSRRNPQQLHLDVAVADLGMAVAAAVSAGARVLSDVQNPDGSPWQVLEDPAGHPFCFVTA